MNKLQATVEFAKLALEIGAIVIRRITNGEDTIRVSDVLPAEYIDRVKLQTLEAAARADYPE